MRSYDEMAQNVFRRGDEYFQKKQKQAAFIKKGVSFMSITGIIIALGLVAGSTQLLSPSIPDEPQQIDLNTDITTTVVTSTAGTAEASVTSTSASATAAASAEVTVTADITTEAFTVTTTAAKTTQTVQTTETTAVTTTAVGTTTTEDIVSDTESSPFTAPDGYEEYAVLSDGVIFKKLNEFSIYFLHGFQYNRISLQLSGTADWDSIYNEYWADLGFDYAGGSAYSALLYDKKEAAGDPRTPTDIEDKLEAAADVCAEMYKAGLLESAEYTKILATLNYGMYERSFKIVDFSGTSDELQQLADGMYEDIRINVYGTEDAPEYYVDFTETDITYDEAMEVCDAIKSTFAGCSVLKSFHYNEDWNPVSTDTIDLLADMQEETENSDLIDAVMTGDVDGSGKVDLTDASIALTIYARRSVWLSTDMYTDEMHIMADVDGDGMISLSDGAYIIQYFSSNAVSIPVTWDEIINA